MNTLKQKFVGPIILLVLLIFVIPRRTDAILAKDLLAFGQRVVQLAVQAKQYLAADGIWYKEYVLDPLSSVLKDAIIDNMIRDINNWAASGFQGSPVFLENPEQFGQNVADIATGAFIEEIGGQLTGDPDFFCKGITDLFVLDIKTRGRRSGLNRFRCTLDRVEQNIERFQNNFANGGWQMLYKIQEESNNPASFYINAGLEAERRQQAARQTFEQGAKATGGYLPNVTCSKRIGNRNPEEDPNFVGPPDPAKQGFCKQYTIHTPAKAIGDRVAEMTGADLKSLYTKDEVSEIVTAFLKSAIRGAIVNLSEPR